METKYGLFVWLISLPVVPVGSTCTVAYGCVTLLLLDSIPFISLLADAILIP